jgi:hypothetical protein
LHDGTFLDKNKIPYVAVIYFVKISCNYAIQYTIQYPYPYHNIRIRIRIRKK